MVDYALGTEPLRASYAGSDATKFDLLIDMVGGDVLEFAVAHLLRPGAAIAHIMNSGSNAAANEKHKAASDAGAGPRWNPILAYPSGAELAEIAQLLASGKAKLNIGHKLPVEQASPFLKALNAVETSAFPLPPSRDCGEPGLPESAAAGENSSCRAS